MNLCDLNGADDSEQNIVTIFPPGEGMNGKTKESMTRTDFLR
jgi:hypothetical protein